MLGQRESKLKPGMPRRRRKLGGGSAPAILEAPVIPSEKFPKDVAFYLGEQALRNAVEGTN